MAASDPFAQTRTVTGAVPCRSVETLSAPNTAIDTEGDAKATPRMHALRFDPVAPGDAPRTPQQEGQERTWASHPAMSLIELGTCAKVRRDGKGSPALIDIDEEGLLTFARTHGPLFARNPFAQALGTARGVAAGSPFAEDRGLWVSAATMANLATIARECVLGELPVNVAADALGGLVKWHIAANGADEGFDLFMLSREVDRRYAAWLGAPAFVRREEGADRIFYSFLLADDSGDGDAWLDMVTASFPHEPTSADFGLLSAALELSPEVDEEVRGQLALPNGREAEAKTGRTGTPGNGLDVSGGDTSHLAADLQGASLPFDENDLPALDALSRALVVAHLHDVRVDVFSDAGETGHLAFTSHLSWLWYDFSNGIGAVRIRYCARCGRAFSTVGRRGPGKRYCSDACRDAAHNERVGARRDDIRTGFLRDGRSVHELAGSFFPEEKAETALQRVRASLSSWPALKRAIDTDIGRHGWHSPLLRRYQEEGLDALKLLSAKRRRELHELGDARRKGRIVTEA